MRKSAKKNDRPKRPKTKFVSSSNRRVRYNHLEHDRYMPPADLIDGPKVYNTHRSLIKSNHREKSTKTDRVPLWYHPIESTDWRKKLGKECNYNDER